MQSTKDRFRVVLSEEEIPRAWYNILHDLPVPFPPPLHPLTKEPCTAEDLAPIFPMGLIEQEVSSEENIEIPDPVLEAYKLYRPSPMHRAIRLEKELDTPARIYYKNESLSPAGSHKLNTAIAQAYYNKKEGVEHLSTETGAGQWGSALALGCEFFDLSLKVFMVRVSFEQKPYRRTLMETWGAEVYSSPTNMTQAGRAVLEADPQSPGSLGIAISEAIETALASENTKYSLGSVLNHVCLHQTVVGLEAEKQMEKFGDYPDVIIGCVGGGSNFSGLLFPFMKDKFQGKDFRAIAVEPLVCPTLTEGKYDYDFGDQAGMTPLLKMYTLGHDFVPTPIHAGGLRYHGCSPILSTLIKEGYVEGKAYPQTEIFEAALLFARTEGIVPAPETAHAIKCAMDEAIACRESGKEKAILFNFSGHGLLDLKGYEEFLAGRLG